MNVKLFLLLGLLILNCNVTKAQAIIELEKGKIIQRYDISRKQITNGIATVTGPIGFMHNEDEFIWVEASGQSTAIRWSSVESYQVV